MSNSLIYTGIIVSKPRMTRSDKWKHREVVDRYWAFKDAIVLAANKQGFKLGNNVQIIFGIPMPKSWSNKKKMEFDCEPHQGRNDIDNLIKGVFDSLLPDNDSGIHTLKAEKKWTDKHDGYILIFNND